MNARYSPLVSSSLCGSANPYTLGVEHRSEGKQIVSYYFDEIVSSEDVPIVADHTSCPSQPEPPGVVFGECKRRINYTCSNKCGEHVTSEIRDEPDSECEETFSCNDIYDRWTGIVVSMSWDGARFKCSALPENDPCGVEICGDPVTTHAWIYPDCTRAVATTCTDKCGSETKVVHSVVDQDNCIKRYRCSSFDSSWTGSFEALTRDAAWIECRDHNNREPEEPDCGTETCGAPTTLTYGWTGGQCIKRATKTCADDCRTRQDISYTVVADSYCGRSDDDGCLSSQDWCEAVGRCVEANTCYDTCMLELGDESVCR